MRRIEFLLAWRYLRGTTHEKNISFMVVICFLGIFIGTLSLALIVSIMNGFEKVTHQKLQGIHAQIVAHAQGNELAMETLSSAFAKEFPMIRAFSGSALKQGIVQGADDNDLSHIVFIKGVDPINENKVSILAEKIIVSVDDSHDLSDLLIQRNILIGKNLAKTLRVTVGDTASLVVNADDTSQKKISLEKKSVIIAGIFDTGIDEFDSGLVICSHALLQTIWPDSGITHLNISLQPQADEAATLAALKTRFEDISFYSWQELYPALVSALKLEKYVMFFILALITLVASMNIISLLFMQISAKRGDIAILQSMGMGTHQISRLFFIMGMGLASIACVLGLITAGIAGWLLQKYPFITLPDAYYMTHLPIAMDVSLFVTVFCAVMILSLCAIVMPLRSIRSFNIANILRFEA